MSDDTNADKPGGDAGATTQALPLRPSKADRARSGEASVTPAPARVTGGDAVGRATAAGSTAPPRPPRDRPPVVPRPAPSLRGDARAAAAPRTSRPRRARLALRRIDPWSVFLFSFAGSLCLGVVLLVAVAALYAMLSALGVISSINDVFAEVTGGGAGSASPAPLVTPGRALGAAGILALIDVVLLTALATLGALLYNLCASLTGGIEVTLAEKD
jgi:hypothetical protein